MNKTNLAWAIIWAFIAVITIIGTLFWNPAHWFTAGISSLLAIAYYNEYVEHKDDNNEID